jgi:DNA-binding NarL/FixJ family response regulator
MTLIMSIRKSQRISMDSRTKVLVVNNEPMLSELLAFLQDQRQNFHFFQEHAATADALEAMESNEIDLVIVDTSANEKNGMNVADEIRSRYPTRPIIILCVDNGEDNKSETMEPGGQHVPTSRKAATEILQALDYADSLLRCHISGFTISLAG